MSFLYKLPRAYICQHDICIPESFILVKDIDWDVILGVPFFHKLMPFSHWDTKIFTGTYKGKCITFDFITQPIQRFLNEIISDKISSKVNQIEFLIEICSLTIEQDLKNPKFPQSPNGLVLLFMLISMLNRNEEFLD